MEAGQNQGLMSMRSKLTGAGTNVKGFSDYGHL